jgi:hypothetical protein
MSETAARPSPIAGMPLAGELAVMLGLSALFPFLIHILPVPENAQLGPRLLPVYYAPLLAVLWGRMPTALTVALLAPWLNRALTGHPSAPGAVVMTIELLAFVVALRALVARFPLRALLAVPAYLASKTASLGAALLSPSLIGGQSPPGWTAHGIVTGLPGVVILLVISAVALRHPPPRASGGGPTAA